MLSPTLRTTATILILACCIIVATAPVHSADPLPLPTGTKPAPTLPKPVAKEIELETEIDLIKLLNRTLVFPDFASLSDTIWQINASEGRRIMRIPLKVSKPDSEVIVTGAAVKVRGGRFVCWNLVDPREEVTGKVETLASGATIKAVDQERLPAGVPRMARSIRLDTDGMIHWKMERSLVGGTVLESATGAYNMKLNPAMVEKLDPGQAPRVLKNAGEKQAEYLKRKQPIEEEYKKKSALYRETRLLLSKLPDEFSGPLPPTLWALYEARGNAKSIEFDGPAPLPWDFPLDLLIQLQRIVATTADGKAETAQPLGTPGATFTVSPVETEILKVLTGEKIHPYTIRLVAHAITLSPFLSSMEEGDSRYQIAAKILSAKDTLATSELMKYLAVRPSKASASLMKMALEAGLLDAKAQLNSVAGMIATLGKDKTASAESAILTINRYLADPKGPAASEVLVPLFALAKDNAALAGPISKGVRVDATGARRDEIILAVLQAAVADPVAMGVLDSRLLGSDDPSLNERTLYLISRAVRPKVSLEFPDAKGTPLALAAAGTPAPKLIALAFWSTTMPNYANQMIALNLLAEDYKKQGVTMVGINADTDMGKFESAVKELKLTGPQSWEGKGLEGSVSTRLAVRELPTAVLLGNDGQILWRGRFTQLEKAIVQQLQPSAGTPAPAAPAGSDPTPQLVSDLGIMDLQHNIFRLLSDTKFRNLAWGALRQMRMTPPPTNATADRAKWPGTIVDLAVGQSPTPVAAVAFLSKHDDAGVAEAMTQLVIRADNDASAAAAKAIYGSGWPMHEVLTKLTSESDRHAFGLRFYENIALEAPFSVGLLRDKADGATIVTWFGNQISAGQLPLPAQWVRPYRSEDRLLLLANLNDEQLAMGAIGTLVAGAGGSGQDTIDVAAKLRANKAAPAPEIAKLWATLRKDLFTAKLKLASTNYATTMRVGIASRTGEVTWGLPTKLNDVAMKVEGPKVTIGTATGAIPADDTLSITLPVTDLKVFDTAAGPLAALKAGGDKPVVFQPLSNTGWIADFALPDGRRLELMLEAKN